MARTLTFQQGDKEFTTELNRVDRKKVYGWVDTVALDREGRECYMGSLSGDGMHVFGRGSFEQGYLTADGRWHSSSDLMAVDEDLHEIPKMPASFKSTIALKESVSVDEYLEHVVKSVYELGDDAALLELVRSTDEIWMFEFNYVASYSPDPAFLVENDGTVSDDCDESSTKPIFGKLFCSPRCVTSDAVTALELFVGM